MDEKTLLRLAKTHGTPLVVVDHKVLRDNYAQFRKHLPRVQAYYAVKANSAPEIVRTFYEAGASFDVASLAEFLTVHENVKDLPEEQRQDFIWDRIIYANPIKATETLEQLDPYKPLVTYDNHEEVIKIARHAPHAGLVLRLRVPNTGSMVELSSKFGALPGEAVDLITFARNNKLEVEGLSFHVGSQCTNVQNYIQALHLASSVFAEARDARLRAQASRHRRRLPGALRRHRPGVQEAGPGYQSGAGPPVSASHRDSRRAWPVPRGLSRNRRRCRSSARPFARKLCYYVNDGVYHTFSGVIFDHCQYPLKSSRTGPTQLCSVFGPTCDALDTISLAEELPDMDLGELVYAQNIGAYSAASSTPSMVSRLPRLCM